MQTKTKLALINSAIAAGLVFAGAFSDGSITSVGLVAAASAAIITFLSNLKDFFSKLNYTGNAYLFKFF